MKYSSHNAFTLVEIAISMTILVIGLTAALSLMMVGINWATDAKINYTAIDAAQSVIDNPGILAKVYSPTPPTPAVPTQLTPVCSGFFNGYYMVRTVDNSSIVTLPNNGGTYVSVRIEGYHGGDDQLGTKVVDLHSRIYIAP